MSGAKLSLSRRAFLQTSAAVALAAVPVRGASAPYRVGVARESDPYAATQRAIAWSGEFPPVLGRTVVVKPNLMMPAAADTGATTDPGVTRAVVDEALARGAETVIVTESSPPGAHFAATGHDAFASYDPRVQLVDAGTLPIVLAPLPGALAYPAILAPDLYLRQDIVFISVGKLKMHEQSFVSLSTKNLFGVPAVHRYVSTPTIGRFAMHDRGLHQAILDVNRLRPTHYAVIDGIWGMEGAGAPAFGSPVRMNTVLAGRNSVAVDRVAMYLMNVAQYAARYLTYASRYGLGPADLSTVYAVGDSVTPRTFALPVASPDIEYPRVIPSAIRPSVQQEATIVLWYGEACTRQIEIARVYNDDPRSDHVRTIADARVVDQGYEWLTWDGRDDAGTIVAPGRYAVRVRADSIRGNVRHSGAIGWVTVNP
jgi:uncharacterized protein (DUF362 family)